jgi:hypothetical protein
MRHCLHCGRPDRMEILVGNSLSTMQPSTMEVPFHNGYCQTCSYRCATCKKLKGAIRRWITVEPIKICSCGLTSTLTSLQLP